MTDLSPAIQSVAPTDEELLELMPETMRAEFSFSAKVCSDATGAQVKPGLFRVVLNTAAVEYARAVLARWGTLTAIQPVPVAPTDAASRVAHYLEQRRLIRGLDPEVINALHAGTDEPRQAALTVSDLEELARWGTPAIAAELEGQ